MVRGDKVSVSDVAAGEETPLSDRLRLSNPRRERGRSSPTGPKKNGSQTGENGFKIS